MMIALDNWNWMPVRQASRITERQDKEDLDDVRFLARTQFGKRLMLLHSTDAYEIIPPEKDEEEWYTEEGVSRGLASTVEMLEQEEKRDVQQMERRALKFCEETEVYCRRAENRRKAEEWKTRPQGQGSRKLASA